MAQLNCPVDNRHSADDFIPSLRSAVLDRTKETYVTPIRNALVSLGLVRDDE
jgi:hypothetical protein